MNHKWQATYPSSSCISLQTSELQSYWNPSRLTFYTEIFAKLRRIIQLTKYFTYFQSHLPIAPHKKNICGIREICVTNVPVGRILTRQLAVFWHDSWLIFNATVGYVSFGCLAHFHPTVWLICNVDNNWKVYHPIRALRYKIVARMSAV